MPHTHQADGIISDIAGAESLQAVWIVEIPMRRVLDLIKSG